MPPQNDARASSGSPAPTMKKYFSFRSCGVNRFTIAPEAHFFICSICYATTRRSARPGPAWVRSRSGAYASRTCRRPTGVLRR